MTHIRSRHHGRRQARACQESPPTRPSAHLVLRLCVRGGAFQLLASGVASGMAATMFFGGGWNDGMVRCGSAGEGAGKKSTGRGETGGCGAVR